mgnify:CR=1 FL=1
MNDKKLFLLSVLNSLGVLAYVSLVVLFMSNTQNIFGQGDNPMIGVVMLLLLILSALITGSLVLGRPILYYLEGQKREGVRLLLFTIIDLVIILTLVILVYLGLR